MWPIQTAFHYHGSKPDSGQAFFDKDLHLFIMDQDQIDKNMEAFKDVYSMRTWKSWEFWLVDIKVWTSSYPEYQLTRQIKSDFKDLDDDLFLFSEFENATAVWEMYKIHFTLDPKLNELGYWSEKEGIQFEEIRKWIRRRDLGVRSFHSILDQ